MLKFKAALARRVYDCSAIFARWRLTGRSPRGHRLWISSGEGGGKRGGGGVARALPLPPGGQPIARTLCSAAISRLLCPRAPLPFTAPPPPPDLRRQPAGPGVFKISPLLPLRGACQLFCLPKVPDKKVAPLALASPFALRNGFFPVRKALREAEGAPGSAWGPQALPRLGGPLDEGRAPRPPGGGATTPATSKKILLKTRPGKI